ncbi:21510_t:CDS:2, partial [Racocetra persica]
MTLSLWYQHAHQFESFSENMTLQSFSILVFGREFHFLSMHFIDDMYIVDEFDAFVIPDSGMNFSQIGIIIEIVKKFKIRLIKYYRQLTQRPRRVTRFPKPGLPNDSQLKLKRNQNTFSSDKTNDLDEEF